MVILPTMTYKEIDRAYRENVLSVSKKIQDAAIRFGGMVKKSSRYPFILTITVTTKDKTKIHLIFTAQKRSQWDHPKLCIYSTYQYHGFTDAISIDRPDGVAHIHTAHFFKRYRERIVKDNNIDDEALIRRYMINNKDMMWHRNTASFSAAYKKHEREDVTQMAARVSEGNCFIERLDKSLFLIKTILSDEMLGISQSSAFNGLEEMRKEYAAMKKKD